MFRTEYSVQIVPDLNIDSINLCLIIHVLRAITWFDEIIFVYIHMLIDSNSFKVANTQSNVRYMLTKSKSGKKAKFRHVSENGVYEYSHPSISLSLRFISVTLRFLRLNGCLLRRNLRESSCFFAQSYQNIIWFVVRDKFWWNTA